MKKFPSNRHQSYPRGPATAGWMKGQVVITTKQATMIAHVLHEIRPAWGIDGTRKVLEKNLDHPASFGEMLAAAVTAALDPDTQTPGRIFQIPTHWPVKAKARLPKPLPCADHIGQDGFTCRSCWADIKAGIRPEALLGKHHQSIAEVLEAPLSDLLNPDG